MTKPRFKLLTNGSRQEMVGGAFEGASRTSREIAMWSPSNTSINHEVSQAKSIVDARSKDLARNDGYIAGAITTHKDSIVGARYALNAKPDMAVLTSIHSGFDEEWLGEFQKSTEAQFTLWAESSDCHVDAQRVNTFTDLVRLVVGVSIMTGESLATAEFLSHHGTPFKTCIQMIDVDRLSNPLGVLDAKNIKRGIEIDKFGAPIAYHIRMSHPSEFRDFTSSKWRRVNARKQWGRRQVLHIFEQERPNQNRAISQMVSVLKEMKMTKKYQDVVLQSAVMNATFAATIESELPTSATMGQLGMDDGGQAAQNYMSQVAEYVGSANNIKLDGAKIPHLYPGQKLNLQNTANPGGVGDKFEQSLLRHVASALGLSYEQFARDYTQTNFASAKASMGETMKYMMSRKRVFADKFATMVYQLWFEEAINLGKIVLPNGFDKNLFYSDQVKDALTKSDWIGAGVGQLDPKKEAETAVFKIQHGLSTHEKECAKYGNDFRDVFAQSVRERKIIEEYKLPYFTQGVNNNDNA